MKGIRKVVLLGAAGVAVAAVGIGVAAWQTSGTGSGFAQATTAQGLTTAPIDGGAAFTTGLLYPGAIGNVRISITNPNPFPVRITSIARTGAITSDKGPACDASTGVTFTDQTNPANMAVAAESTSTFTLANAVRMDNTSANECQGARFTIPVTITGVSAPGETTTPTTTDTTPTTTPEP